MIMTERMDEATARIVQREGAAALLDRGVSVPLTEMHIPFRKKPLKLRVIMRRPRLGGLIRLARVYLGLGVTAKQIMNFTKEEEMVFIARHGNEVSRMVAYTLCRGWISRHLLVGITAWVVRELVKPEYLQAALANFILLLGVDPFMSIIRLAERVNPMKLRLSHVKKGS